jgi:ABC-type multidrug transport system fused ATPase/permease subunit
MQNPFWKSTKILLHYKRPLFWALAGAVLSAACFGAGLSMMLPLFHLLLAKGQGVNELIREHLIDASRPAFIQNLGQWLTTMIPDDKFWSFVVVMGAIAALSTIGSAGRYFHTLITNTVVTHATMRWRRRIFRRLIHAPLIDVMRAGTADRISRFSSDVIIMSNGYKTVLGKSAHAALHGMTALLFAVILNWQLFVLVMGGGLVLGVLLRKFGKRIRRATKLAMQGRGKMLGALTESLAGIRVVKVHNAEGYERRRFTRVNRELFEQEMKARTVRALSSPLVELLALLGVMFVATIAAWMIFKEGHKAEEFMTTLVMLVGGAVSLKPLTALHNDLHESGAAAQRIMELTELSVEPTGVDTPRDAVILARHHESIIFNKVTFHYGGERDAAVQEVTLPVKHGQTVAIVGPNGSGKTTLLSMLSRLIVPTAGAITIDGHDIMTLSLRSLRKQLAVVTQHTVLFEGTIAQNIAYGRRFESDERIVAAAKAGHAHSFIAALPLGYNTRLGESGVGLSGGQMQRIAIARAVLRDPAILILDEATSQIDSESESEIAKALTEISKGRTTFVIAHRLSTVINSDVIVVMQTGRVIDLGRHTELLERCPTYRTLVQTQLLASAG